MNRNITNLTQGQHNLLRKLEREKAHKIPNIESLSVAEASKLIDELLALPDAEKKATPQTVGFKTANKLGKPLTELERGYAFGQAVNIASQTFNARNLDPLQNPQKFQSEVVYLTNLILETRARVNEVKE